VEDQGGDLDLSQLEIKVLCEFELYQVDYLIFEDSCMDVVYYIIVFLWSLLMACL
jgi:hypothetical protein